MKQKIISKLSNEDKAIKVIGQGSCTKDCAHWHELSGQQTIGGYFGCSTYSCQGYYTYDAHWTDKF